MAEFRPSQEGRVSIAEYLRDEERRTVRHEYLRGEVYAMSGGTAPHSQIAANIIAHLHAAARRGACRVYTSDFKVQPSDQAVYYPDVSVVCQPTSRSAVVTAAPCLVVEITSRGTARLDRGEKLEQYRKCASLKAYLIVDQFRRRVTHHWRDDTDDWQSDELSGSGTIRVSCPETTLTLDQIYEAVELPPLQVGESEPTPEEDELVTEQ
jgi:Uma2 family endonuclease